MRRAALIQAHIVSSAVIRQYLDTAEHLDRDGATAAEMEAALLELADRHDRSAARMMAGHAPRTYVQDS
jgi:hypothetical protein